MLRSLPVTHLQSLLHDYGLQIVHSELDDLQARQILTVSCNNILSDNLDVLSVGDRS